MYLPASSLAASFWMIFFLLCWGSWINIVKFNKSWRFELYFWNITFGILLTSIILSLTFGRLGHYGLPFFEDMFQSHFRYIVQGILAGVLLNIAVILLTASVIASGIAFTYISVYAAALAVNSVMNFLLLPHQRVISLLWGLLFLLLTFFFATIGHKRNPNKANPTKKFSSLPLFSGLLLGLFYPLVSKAMSVDHPEHLGPYTMKFFLSIGFLISNLVINTFLMKKPFIGHPVSWRDYFRMKTKPHLLSLFAGGLAGLGIISSLVAIDFIPHFLSFSITHLVPLIACFYGLYIWKEFSNESGSLKFIIVSLFLYMVGACFIAFAEFSR